MQRKIETIDLDMPKDDLDCWNRYPKHRWVYELSRLLDAQNIKWSPFEQTDLPHRELNMRLYTREPIIRQPGFIYIEKPTGNHLLTEVYIVKGEIKLMRHLDPDSGQELPVLIGEIELRLSAFISLYFSKFTGIITTETFSNEIFHIQLRSNSDLSLTSNQEISKLIKKIYKKTDITIYGLTDRIHRETLAS